MKLNKIPTSVVTNPYQSVVVAIALVQNTLICYEMKLVDGGRGDSKKNVDLNIGDDFMFFTTC